MMNEVLSMAMHKLSLQLRILLSHAERSARALSGTQPGRGSCLGATAGALQGDMQELPFCIPRALAL